MKKIIKVTIMLLFFFGCSSKELPISNEAIIDKKPLFSLSSLSIETGYNYISGEQKIGENISLQLQKRADDSIYFTKFKKGILKLKIISIEAIETKERKGSFLYFFPSYSKGYKATLIYSLSAYSPNGEELQRAEQKIAVSVNGQDEQSRKELIEKIADSFQNSIFKTSKETFGKFLAG